MLPDPSDRHASGGASRAHAGAPALDAPSEMPGRGAMLSRVSGDTNLLAAMAGLFLDECPRLVAGIRQAVAGHDARTLETAAHALRGSVSNFAADATTQAALRLELMGRDGDLTQSGQALAELEDELERLRPVLEELT